MNPVNVLHIFLLLSAYAAYLFVTLRSFSGKIPYRLLTAANLSYVVGYALGMLWANDAWGFYLSPDPKIILSALVPVPYVLENILKSKRWHLPTLGAFLIAANYILPQLLSSTHMH